MWNGKNLWKEKGKDNGEIGAFRGLWVIAESFFPTLAPIRAVCFAQQENQFLNFYVRKESASRRLNMATPLGREKGYPPHWQSREAFPGQKDMGKEN